MSDTGASISYSLGAEETRLVKETGTERPFPKIPATEVHKATASIYDPHKFEVNKQVDEIQAYARHWLDFREVSLLMLQENLTLFSARSPL